MSYRVKIESTKALQPSFDVAKNKDIVVVKATVIYECTLAEAALLDGQDAVLRSLKEESELRLGDQELRALNNQIELQEGIFTHLCEKRSEYEKIQAEQTTIEPQVTIEPEEIAHLTGNGEK